MTEENKEKKSIAGQLIEDSDDKNGSSGSTLGSDIIASETAPKDKITGKTILHWLKKWWMIPVYIILAVILVIFISGGDEDDLFKAHFKAENMVTVGDTDYTLLSKDDKDHYIGSFVSDRLTGISEKKVATMRSYLLYVSVFYSVQGDPDMNYLMDGKKAVYVKSTLYDEAKAYYEDKSHITSYKMTDKTKDMKNMTDLTVEDYKALIDLKGEETVFTDTFISENYATRREIFGYYDNGLFCRAVLELFRDKEENLYLTTEMIDGKTNPDGGTVLKGIKLPKELRDRFWAIWG